MMCFQNRFFLFAATTLLLLTGCEDKKLAKKVSALEAELAVIKAAEQERIGAATAKAEEITRRLELTEQKSTDAANQVATSATGAESRFQRLEKSISELVQLQEKRENTVFLSPDVKTPTALQTKFGVFLLRLEGLAWDSGLSQYIAKIGVGNLIGLTVQEFTVKGDFGGGAPKLIPGEDYADFNKRMTNWEATMTPYEHTITQQIDAKGWTSFELPLNAKSETDLQLIRLTMSVQKALLSDSTPKAKKTSGFSLVSVGGNGSTIETKYGEYLIKIIAAEPEGASTRVHLTIGNPLGFTITQSRLSGKYGMRAPEKLTSERPEMFAQRQRQWMGGLKEFNSVVIDPLNPFRWSQVSILIPESDHTKVQSLLMTLQLEKLNLPKSR